MQRNGQSVSVTENRSYGHVVHTSGSMVGEFHAVLGMIQFPRRNFGICNVHIVKFYVPVMGADKCEVTVGGTKAQER